MDRALWLPPGLSTALLLAVADDRADWLPPLTERDDDDDEAVAAALRAEGAAAPPPVGTVERARLAHEDPLLAHHSQFVNFPCSLESCYELGRQRRL